MSDTHIHNGTLFSHKKNEITPFAATWMDLEIIRPSEASQTEKNKTIRSLTYGTNLFLKQKQTHKHRKQTYRYQK